MNAFYASVETLYHPEARGVPMAVCGDVESRRGVILAKNDLAKSLGIKTAEPVLRALEECPGLLLLPPHQTLYSDYSRRANLIYQRYTDLVEPVSIDESYLDVTGSRGLFGNGEQIANAIRAAINRELGLTVSVGVSFCKVFAKLGSDYKKPDATTVITRENYKEILHPLPVTDLMYVGGATAKILRLLGVETIGGLAALEPTLLEQKLGKHGRMLHAYANGQENSLVRPLDAPEEIKSIGNSITYKRDLVTLEDIRAGLLPLAESVARRLRAKGLKCGGVQISIKDSSFKTIDRQQRLEQPTHQTRVIYLTALALLQRSWRIGSPIRLLSVTAIALTDGSEGYQTSLFAQERENPRGEALDSALDSIRQKYGKSAVKHASILENDLGIDG